MSLGEGEDIMRNKGFTLLEMLIVVAIIGVLVLMFVSNSKSHWKEAELKSMQGNAKALETAVASYYLNNDAYPNSTTYDLSAIPEEVVHVIETELEKKGSGKTPADFTYYNIDGAKLDIKGDSDNYEKFFFTDEEPLSGMVFSKQEYKDRGNTVFSGVYSEFEDRPHLSMQGMVGYWHYQNTDVPSNTLYNTSPTSLNLNNGTFVDGYGDPMDVSDSGIRFTNFTNGINMNNPLQNKSSFTIELLVNPSVLTAQHYLVSTTNNIAVTFDNSKRLVFVNDMLYSRSNKTFVPNEWIHYTLVVSPGVQKTYINGVLDQTTNYPGMAWSGSSMRFATVNNFRGYLKTIRLYDRTLTDEEVLEHYRYGDRL